MDSKLQAGGMEIDDFKCYPCGHYSMKPSPGGSPELIDYCDIKGQLKPNEVRGGCPLFLDKWKHPEAEKPRPAIRAVNGVQPKKTKKV